MKQIWQKRACVWLLIVVSATLITVSGLCLGAWVGVRQLTIYLFEQNLQWTYETWRELAGNELLIQLVPRSATNIKRRDFVGFRVYQCDVSCSVSLRALESFAKERGYVFKPVDSRDVIATGRIVDNAKSLANAWSEGVFSKSDFLGCSFSRKTQSGTNQHFEFVYDMVHQKLYCRYSDG